MHFVDKNDNFGGKLSIFWLEYNLFMLLIHTRGLVCRGSLILLLGPILNMVHNQLELRDVAAKM